jgi:hypothetical protein
MMRATWRLNQSAKWTVRRPSLKCNVMICVSVAELRDNALHFIFKLPVYLR